MPRVTVVTPTFNQSRFIRDCVESVLAQTITDWEMVIVDDGSDDDTVEIARSFDDQRVKVVPLPHRGLAALAETYNTALKESSGEFVAILEGDDTWPPTKLEQQLPAFKDQTVVLASGVTKMVSSTGEFEDFVPMTMPWPQALVNDPVGEGTLALLDVRHLTFTFPVSTIIRRTALDQIGGFQQPPYLPLVDLPTFVAVSRLGKFAWSSEVCGVWRRHQASTTTDKMGLILDGVYRFLGEQLATPSFRASLPADRLQNLADDWSANMVHRAVLLALDLARSNRYREAMRATELAWSFPGPPRRKAKALAARIGLSLRLPEDLIRKMTGTSGSVDTVNKTDRIIDAGMLDRVTPWSQ